MGLWALFFAIGALAQPSLATASRDPRPGPTSAAPRAATSVPTSATCSELTVSDFKRFPGGCHLWVVNADPHHPFVQIDCRASESSPYAPVKQLKAPRRTYNGGVTEPAEVAAILTDCGKLLDRAFPYSVDEENPQNRANSTYFSKNPPGKPAPVMRSVEYQDHYKNNQIVDSIDMSKLMSDFFALGREMQLSGEAVKKLNSVVISPPPPSITSIQKKNQVDEYYRNLRRAVDKAKSSLPSASQNAR